MKKDGTASATGNYVEFQAAVLRALPRDISPDVAFGWTQNGEALARVLKDVLTPDGKPVGNVYPVTVNYDLSVEDAVIAGKYGWANSDISSKHFPSQRKGTTDAEIILVHFNRDTGSDDVLRDLDKQGLRPAELPELLAFGSKYPDVQREFPVIALGSMWQGPDGSRFCACLDRLGSRRDLGLIWLDTWWYDYCRFAALRK